LLATSRLKAGPHVLLAATLAALGVGLQAFLILGPGGRSKALHEETQLGSALYELSVSSYKGFFPPTEAQQGGISRFDDRYMLVSGDGDLFFFREAAEGRRLEVQPLTYKVPINRQEFSAAGGPTTGRRTWFRVADILVQPTSRGHRLLVTHHYWKQQERCWVMRVSGLEGSTAELLSPSKALEWTTIFESQPCMPLSLDGGPIRFSGINNGGRMVLLDDRRLLVSIGDHEMDGYATTLQAAQEPTSSYGKLVLVDLSNRGHEVFSLGHRNPQGLAVAVDGTIWETEHGPQGGDELNLVRQGTNYGWPLETYGTEYGTHAWPLSETPGSHDKYVQPVYSWVPSIGTSNLIEVRSDRFSHWRGDLLVGALRGRSLWRLRIREGRVAMAEQIEIGQRIRDLEVGHRGELVLLADGGSLHFVTPREGEATGEGLYRVCAGCHVAPKGAAVAVGPGLEGIVGREIGADPDFGYSEAMRSVKGEWTPERLDAFLADPASVVPGTTMQFTGIRDAESRRILVEYMASPGSRLDVMPVLRE
jgi:cytochrome c2